MIQTPPFPWKARMPKETEIFRLSGGYSNVGGRVWEWHRTFLGTYTPSKYLTLTKAPTSLEDASLDADEPAENISVSDSMQSGAASGEEPHLVALNITPIYRNWAQSISLAPQMSIAGLRL